jgi:hypothetical protein
MVRPIRIAADPGAKWMPMRATPKDHGTQLGWPRLAVLAALFALAAATGLCRYGVVLFGQAELGDESAYLCAFRSVRDGTNPYLSCPRYLYLPAFSRVGGWALASLGEPAIRIALRLAIVLGGAMVAVFAAGLVRAAIGVRMLVVVAIMLCPPMAEGIGFGNVSPLVAGLACLALFLWPRFSVAAGVALGAGLLVKPMALLLPLAILAAPHAGRRGWMTAGIAVVVFAASVFPWWRDLSSIPGMDTQIHAHTNMALARGLFQFGLPVPALVVLALVAALVVVAMRRRLLISPMDAWHRVARVGLCGSIVALPVVWNHTLILLLPVLAWAVAAAFRDLRAAWRSPRRSRAMLYALFVVVGILLTLQSDSLAEIDPRHGAIESALLLVSLLFPWFVRSHPGHGQELVHGQGQGAEFLLHPPR